MILPPRNFLRQRGPGSDLAALVTRRALAVVWPGRHNSELRRVGWSTNRNRLRRTSFAGPTAS